MFLQVHFLTSYHASLLNRDDVGLAKRINYGGVPRLRVSSQCQKRHWREHLLKQNLALPRGFRTRHFCERMLVKILTEEYGMDEQTALDLALHLMGRIIKVSKGKAKGGSAKGNGKGKGKKKSKAKKTNDVDGVDVEPEEDEESAGANGKDLVVLFGEPEARFFVHVIREAAGQGNADAAKAYIDVQLQVKGEKNQQDNLMTLMKECGFTDPRAGYEGAMFGRFITSDILARVDAPVHVAHAFTTHALDTEIDYFTTVDDLAGNDTGAAHVNDMELGAGVFYGYVAVDVPLLVSNLTGCSREDWDKQESDNARCLLNSFIRAIAEVTPGAKLGATAPYARSECVVLEVGNDQPYSLANAFLTPVNTGRNGANPMELSIRAMAEKITGIDGMFGDNSTKRFVAVPSYYDWPRANELPMSLQAAIDHSLNAIFGI